HRYWYSGDMIPMGSNFQLVFYRSRRSEDVLVKLLYNEKERTVPGLTPVQGPYYNWSEMRAYFCRLCGMDS
ncbi:MAG: histidine-type phosphatase, partial [Bacteroidales bacterium]|nr:histidine-type phosphatase [Bacteroidales bacterium]